MSNSALRREGTHDWICPEYLVASTVQNKKRLGDGRLQSVRLSLHYLSSSPTIRRVSNQRYIFIRCRTSNFWWTVRRRMSWRGSCAFKGPLTVTYNPKTDFSCENSSLLSTPDGVKPDIRTVHSAHFSSTISCKKASLSPSLFFWKTNETQWKHFFVRYYIWAQSALIPQCFVVETKRTVQWSALCM